MLLLEQDDVTATFSALGDPVRRAIVDRLVTSDATVNELAALFPISLQAVSKHIKVLEAAGVVSRGKLGQTRPVRFEPACLERAVDWIESRRRQLEARYARLDDLLAELQQPIPHQATPGDQFRTRTDPQPPTRKQGHTTQASPHASTTHETPRDNARAGSPTSPPGKLPTKSSTNPSVKPPTKSSTNLPTKSSINPSTTSSRKATRS